MPNEHQTFTVVAYDIPDDNRRNKVAAICEDFGERVQFSVFECYLSAEQRDEMTDKLLKKIERKEDTIRMYQICADCVKRTIILGLGELWEEPGVVII